MSEAVNIEVWFKDQLALQLAVEVEQISDDDEFPGAHGSTQEDLLDMVMQVIEPQLGYQIPDAHIAMLTTVGKWTRYLYEQLGRTIVPIGD